jgi:hypothetical protein
LAGVGVAKATVPHARSDPVAYEERKNATPSYPEQIRIGGFGKLRRTSSATELSDVGKIGANCHRT